MLGLEDTGSRMSRLGKGELLYDELLTVDELLPASTRSPGGDREVAAEVLGQPMSLAVIGPFAGHDFSAAIGRVTRSGATGALGWAM